MDKDASKDHLNSYITLRDHCTFMSEVAYTKKAHPHGQEFLPPKTPKCMDVLFASTNFHSKFGIFSIIFSDLCL